MSSIGLFGDRAKCAFPGFREVEVEELAETSPIWYRQGVCTIQGTKGTLGVPDGQVAIRLEYKSFSTGGGYESAKVLNARGLVSYLRALGQHYLQLAEQYNEEEES